MTKALLTLFTLLTCGSALAAGDCSLSIDRTPCEGKETDARKPYSGKNPTEEKKEKAATADECLKEGEKAAKIVRKGTLAKKVVTVSFGGKEVGKKEDTQSCKK